MTADAMAAALVTFSSAQLAHAGSHIETLPVYSLPCVSVSERPIKQVSDRLINDSGAAK